MNVLTQPDGRLSLPRTISAATIVAVLGAFAGLVTTWTHFENRATNNAQDIATLKDNVMTLRNELRDLERSYDKQISHLDALVNAMIADSRSFPQKDVP